VPVLFTASELSEYLGRVVSAGEAAIAERVAAGWLAEATGVAVWPDPPPPQVFSWAIELAALAHDNPSALASRTVDGITDSYSRERWGQIMTAARGSSVATGLAAAAGPVGSFPQPVEWPDPPRSFYRTS
jgi:hypothetical protein